MAEGHGTASHGMGERRFGRLNRLGLATLIRRETMRFSSIWMQTICAPLVTAGLFLAIFSIAIGPTRGDVMGQPFLHFIAPGILTMTVIQNAFANTSSSILVSKIQGSIVDTLMPPLSAGELVTGYIAGGVARGLFIGIPLMLLMILILGLPVHAPLVAFGFMILGASFMAGLGLLAGIYARKFDQVSAISNFIVTPLSFLSGTFYSAAAVPPVMQGLLHWNPVFYLIDGVRYGILGVSDRPPLLGFVILAVATTAVLGLCWRWMRTGYHLKA